MRISLLGLASVLLCGVSGCEKEVDGAGLAGAGASDGGSTSQGAGAQGGDDGPVGGSGASGGAGTGAGSSEGGGGASTPGDACDPYSHRTPGVEVFIGPSGIKKTILPLIDAAATSVDLLMYQFGDDDYTDALIDAAERGVKVRVLRDADEYLSNAAKNALEDAGGEVKPAPSQFEHNHTKVMIVDGQLSVVMSANMNDYTAGERNYGIVDRDAEDIADLQAIFDRDWKGSGDLDVSCTRLIVSPLNAEERLLEFISSTKTELDIAIMYMSDDDTKAAVMERIAAGIPTRVLLANPEWIADNAATGEALIAEGAEVKFFTKYDLHAKLFISDDRTLFGSLNASWTSIHSNREVSVIVTEPEPVAKIQKQFASDWTSGEL